MRLVRIASRVEYLWSGVGAARNPGRWNRHGQEVLYTARSLAMAQLEVLVHISRTALPGQYVFGEYDAPDSVSREIVDPMALPGWDDADLSVGRAFGSQWVREGRTCLLIVPSAVVPFETNAIVNPLHPDFAAIVPLAVRPFAWDARLFQ